LVGESTITWLFFGAGVLTIVTDSVMDR
jgi:hypothetical protein